ncbi:hypothetical protein RHS01_05831 [Rhizoctonia solani]|uniref:Uncharacterized protein n=1 Tax=Rhizoctonia solani TaxID=456999 RepID=A0A8H7M463_9AGAM|nr:hypothetical protein RHS01_05831 [Rhizoctonia solani]
MFLGSLLQPPSHKPSPPPTDLPQMEPEPTITTLLKAIQVLTTQVGSLQDQVRSQGKQLTQLTTLCKETNNLIGDKDQGQGKPITMAGPVTPQINRGAKLTVQKWLGLEDFPLPTLSGPLETQWGTNQKRKSQGEQHQMPQDGAAGPL